MPRERQRRWFPPEIVRLVRRRSLHSQSLRFAPSKLHNLSPFLFLFFSFGILPGFVRCECVASWKTQQLVLQGEDRLILFPSSCSIERGRAARLRECRTRCLKEGNENKMNSRIEQAYAEEYIENVKHAFTRSTDYIRTGEAAAGTRQVLPVLLYCCRCCRYPASSSSAAAAACSGRDPKRSSLCLPSRR